MKFSANERIVDFLNILYNRGRAFVKMDILVVLKFIACLSIAS